jgi:hypothetical protein
LGFTSYYPEVYFVVAKIAFPLHALTCKDAKFQWSEECQAAFNSLKEAITRAPVLAYPDFDLDFTLETDASVKGLGAVLMQRHSDQTLHPVAFASHSLSPAEKNYSITELETLAVVLAVQHFHAYLYGHNVVVVTDHLTVNSNLGAPSNNGKFPR